LQPTPVLLAVVMFLWTPPHFWSLAAAKGDDYRKAGVPMLPIVVPEYAWTLAILSHTLVLAVLSLVPLAFGMGPVYGVFAAVGGGLFLWRSWQLFMTPSREAAMANFKASLVQFCLLTTGVFLDAAIKWAV
jgi:protoheme IX farnesyltransferase